MSERVDLEGIAADVKEARDGWFDAKAPDLRGYLLQSLSHNTTLMVEVRRLRGLLDEAIGHIRDVDVTESLRTRAGKP